LFSLSCSVPIRSSRAVAGIGVKDGRQATGDSRRAASLTRCR